MHKIYCTGTAKVTEVTSESHMHIIAPHRCITLTPYMIT